MISDSEHTPPSPPHNCPSVAVLPRRNSTRQGIFDDERFPSAFLAREPLPFTLFFFLRICLVVVWESGLSYHGDGVIWQGDDAFVLIWLPNLSWSSMDVDEVWKKDNAVSRLSFLDPFSLVDDARLLDTMTS